MPPIGRIPASPKANSAANFPPRVGRFASIKPAHFARGATLLLATIALPVTPTRGADLYWDGPSGGWEIVANWSTSSFGPTPDPAAVPGAADRAIFRFDTETVSLNGARAVNGITFEGPATLIAGSAASHMLTIGAGGMAYTSGGTSPVTLGQAGSMVNITLSAPQTWSSNTVMDIAGTVTNNNHTLTLGGGAQGAMRIHGAIGSGAGGITKTGAGKVTMFAAHSYTGATSVLEGTLELLQPAPAGSNGTLGRATSAVLLGATSGSANAALMATSTVGRNIVVQAGNTGLISLGGQSSNYTGTITLNKTLELAVTALGSGMATASGVISGSGGLTKSGGGIFALTNANPFTGPVTINAGALRITNPAGLGTNPIVTLATVSSDAGTLEMQGNLTLGAGRTLIMASPNAGSATPRLRSAVGRNTWAGPVTITGLGSVLFHGSTAAELVVSGAVTALDAANAGAEIRLSGSGLVTFEQTVNAPTRGFQVSAGGAVVLRGGGNSWNATKLTTGSLRVEVNGGLPAAPLSFGSASDFNATALLDLAGTTQAVTAWSTLNVSTPARFHLLQNSSAVTAATFAVTAAASNFVNSVEFRAGAGLTLDKQGTGLLNFNAILPGRANFAIKEGDLRFSSSGLTVAQGSITGDPGAVFSVHGPVVVLGRFDHAGTTTINNRLTVGAGTAGAIQVNDNRTLAVGLAGGRLTAGPVTFGVAGASTFAPVLTTPGGDPLLTAANITVVGAQVLVQPQGRAFATGTYPLMRSTNGVIGGQGFPAFALGSPGTYPHMTAALVHDAADGRIDLQVSAVDGLTWTGAVSGAWAPNGAENFHLTLANIPGPFWPSDRVRFDDTGLNRAITLPAGSEPQVQIGDLVFHNSIGNDYTITGGLHGPGGVAKFGTGTVTLDGTFAATGPIEVHDGTLVLRGRNIAGGSVTIDGGLLDAQGILLDNPIEVLGGALRGIGTVGPVTIEGGALQPGPSTGVGTLTTGNLTLLDGTLLFDITDATAADQISVSGLVNFGGNVELALSFPAYNPRDDLDVFTLVMNDEADAISRGGFGFTRGGELLGEGATFTAAGSGGAQLFQLSYQGGTGNDVVLRAIPEPASGIGILLGFGVVVSRRRRRSSVSVNRRER